MPRQQFALTQRGTLHVYPAREECNLDSSKRKIIFYEGDEPKRRKVKRECQHCIPVAV
jgi:hypothetical protein